MSVDTLQLFNYKFNLKNNAELTHRDTYSYVVKYQVSEHNFKNVVFQNIYEFIDIYRKCILHGDPTYFHEIPDRGVGGFIKLFLDLDITTRSKNLYRQLHDCETVEDELTILKSIILDPIGETDFNDWHISSHHRRDKFSYHFIHRKKVFVSVTELGEFVRTHYTHAAIDYGVYRANHSMRLLYSSKRGTPGYITPLHPQELSNRNLEENLIYTPIVIPNQHVLVRCPVSTEPRAPLLHEEMSYTLPEILQCLPEDLVKGYKFIQQTPTKYLLQRRPNIQVSCIQCERLHERQNALLYINRTDTNFVIRYQCLNYRPTAGQSKVIDLYRETFEKIKKKVYPELMRLQSDPRKELSVSSLGVSAANTADLTKYQVVNIDTPYLEYATIEPLLRQYKKLNLFLYLPCGMGKSSRCVDIINRYTTSDDLVLFLTCRRTLNSNLLHRINAGITDPRKRLKSYMVGGKVIQTYDETDNARIVQVESLSKLCSDMIDRIMNDGCRLFLFLDEYPNTIKQLSSNTNRTQIHDNQKVFINLVKRSDYNICMSGTPDVFTTEFLVDVNSHENVVMRPTEIRPMKDLYVYEDRPTLTRRLMNTLSHLHEDVQSGVKSLPIGVCWTDGVKNHKVVSKLDKFIKLVRHLYPRLNILVICSHTKQTVIEEFSRNPDIYLTAHDIHVLIYTPTMYIGVDITIPFTECFMYIYYRNTYDPTDIIQLVFRLRQCRNNHMIIGSYGMHIQLDSAQDIRKRITAVMNLSTELDVPAQMNSNIDYLSKLGKLNHTRTQYLVRHYLVSLYQYLVNNRILVRSYEDYTIDMEQCLSVREMKKVARECAKTLKHEKLDVLNSAKVLTPEEYTAIQTRDFKTSEEYSQIIKYHIHHYLGYDGEITKEILRIRNTHYTTIRNLRMFLDIEDDNEQVVDIAQLDLMRRVEEMLITGEGLYPKQDMHNLTTLGKQVLRKIHYRRLGVKLNTIAYKMKRPYTEILKLRVRSKLLDFNELMDQEDLHALVWNCKDYQYKTYVAIYFIGLFDLPILQECTYEKDAFMTLCKSVQSNLKELRELNEISFTSYMTILGYDRKRNLDPLMEIEIDETTLKPYITFLNKIVELFGFEVKSRNSNNLPIYNITFKPILKKHLSLFRRNGKVPLIKRDALNISGDTLREFVDKFDTLLK